MQKIIILFISLQMHAGFFNKTVDWVSKSMRHSTPISILVTGIKCKGQMDQDFDIDRLRVPMHGKTIDLARWDYKFVGNDIPLLIRKEAEKKLGKARASQLTVVSLRALAYRNLGVMVDQKSRECLLISPDEFTTIYKNKDQRKINQARALVQHEFTHLKEGHCNNSIFELPTLYAGISQLLLYGLSLCVRPSKNFLLTVSTRCIFPITLAYCSSLAAYPIRNTIRDYKSHEWQADEGIADDPIILQSAIDFFKNTQEKRKQLPLMTRILSSIEDANCHPSNEARIARFEERLALLKQKSSSSVA